MIVDALVALHLPPLTNAANRLSTVAVGSGGQRVAVSAVIGSKWWSTAIGDGGKEE